MNDAATRIIHETIGAQKWDLTETKLHVHDQIVLWAENPRLQTSMMEGFSSQEDLEAALRLTRGYDGLRKSIQDIGQMQPIYVQQTSAGKYLVLEGATRVTILRELDRKFTSGKNEGVYKCVDAKILPPNFEARDVAILLAGIHVRGSGVRDWGRYIEAKFIYETVNGRPPSYPSLMNQTTLAQNMGKSEAWVARLKGAYEFALKFIEHSDGEPNVKKLASENFSILEEISKAKIIGSQLRDFDNKAYDQLRSEVFDMVKNEVFKEYRDARFLKDFHDDPDAWQQLKSGEKHIANELAQQTRSKSNSPKAKIANIPQLVRRAAQRGDGEFDEEDINNLQQTIDLIEDQVHEGVHPYRLAVKKATRTFNKASRADVQDLAPKEIADLQNAYEYFCSLVKEHSSMVEA